MDESWVQVMNDELRERQLYEALDECQAKGVSREALITLLFETGARWMPNESHASTASVG